MPGRSVSIRAAALALIVPATLAGCTKEPEHASLKHAQLPPLIQAHRFAYQGDVRGSYQLSPDGRKLAWIGPSHGRSVLHVANALAEFDCRHPLVL